MPEETVRQASMTTYEIIATILAVIALLQPWIITIWKNNGNDRTNANINFQ